MKKLNSDFVYLEDMYNDNYYPRFLVDKVKDCIVEVVEFLEKEEYEDLEEVQEKLDEMKEKCRELHRPDSAEKIFRLAQKLCNDSKGGNDK